MTSVTSQALLRTSVLVLLIGCSPSTRTGQTGSEAPVPDNTPGDPRVTAEDIQRAPGESLEEMLRGRIAGVTVTRAANGGIAVRIRGGTSLLNNNAPLYVLDGMPIEPGPDGSLTGIAPNDIESIRVLKDPTDTAMYGIRGANGVIVIKTKGAARKTPG